MHVQEVYVDPAVPCSMCVIEALPIFSVLV